MLSLGTLACGTPDAPIELLIRATEIHALPSPEGTGKTVQALGISGGLVVAHDGEAEDRVGEGTRIEELGDKAVWPGFIDSHTHMMAGSFVLDRLVLLGMASQASIENALAGYAPEHPDEPWIVGYGWLPGIADELDGRSLDAIVPDRPVLLADSSGHTALVNTAALVAAGIDRHTPDPPGGTIARDEETGEPTGVLFEAALSLVSVPALAAFKDEDFAASIVGAADDFARVGVTTVAEILASPGFDLGRPWVIEEAAAEGNFALGAMLFLPVNSAEGLAAAADEGRGIMGDQIRFGGLKAWVDGSMGSVQGWVSEPIEGTSDNFGTQYLDADELVELVDAAEREGVALKLHINGDAGMTAALDAFEGTAASRGLTQAHTIEHAVLVTPEDLQRMAALGIHASIQPTHWVAARYGDGPDLWGEERFARAYDHGAMARAGVNLALGTDWPVWPTPDPLLQVWAAASLREDDSGLTVAQGMHAATRGAAAALGREGDLGCLEVGCQADLVVLDRDPLDVDPTELPDLIILDVFRAGLRIP